MANIRKATAGDLDGVAAVLSQCWRTDYRGIVPDEHLETITPAERRGVLAPEMAAMETAGGNAFFVAEDNGRIIGFACGGARRSGPSDFEAELYRVYVAPAHQRRGTGGRLVCEFVRWLKSQGYARMLLWTFEENAAASRFYESIGGRRLPDTKIYERAGKSIEMIAYGWEDLDALVGTLEERPPKR